MSDESKLSSYLFFVEIDGIETARFQKCEGLEAETESFEYEEGGGEVHHFQGRTRYPNLVLEKGINDNNELFNWFQSITKDEKVELSIQNNTPWFHIGQNMSEETNFIGADEDFVSIGAIEGYPETGNNSWRADNDQAFIDACNNYNEKYGLSEGDDGYVSPKMLKAYE